MKGNPFFVQKRPGKKSKDGKEKLFPLIKFRTMSNAKDKDGNLLPDEKRLNAYGKFLRSTSLDELPEEFNIFLGHMSVIGPRPQLVRDMIFMSEKQRHRHDIRPGLSGLAQINGRNNASWDQRFDDDLKYLSRYSFFYDIKIIVLTVLKMFKKSDVNTDGMATSEDYGDYLLRLNLVTNEEYDEKIIEAKKRQAK